MGLRHRPDRAKKMDQTGHEKSASSTRNANIVRSSDGEAEEKNIALRDKLRLRQPIPKHVPVTQVCPHALA